MSKTASRPKARLAWPRTEDGWGQASRILFFAALALSGSLGRAEPPRTVNPSEYVSHELKPYVGRFEDVLRAHGFTISQVRESSNLDFQLGYLQSAMAIRVTPELRFQGRVVVSAPTKNTTFSKAAALGPTVDVAAQRFSAALSRHAASPSNWNANTSTEKTGEARSIGLGTAFAVADGNWFLTAYHVVGDAESVVLKCGDLDPAEAKVYKIDPANDIALLKADVRTPAALSLAPDGAAAVGGHVFTMGFPNPELLGVQPKYTEGVISSLTGMRDYSNVMQITVPIQPGNSGGPLVDESGNVVGIITSSAAVRRFYATTGAFPQNVNWAVRAEYARPMLAGIAQPPRKGLSRDQAIQNAGSSLCLVFTE